MIFFREFARATPFIGLKDFKITWGILFQWPDSAARRAPVSGVLITTSVGRRAILEPEELNLNDSRAARGNHQDAFTRQEEQPFWPLPDIGAPEGDELRHCQRSLLKTGLPFSDYFSPSPNG